LKKKHGKTLVRVAARTSQADTIQYTAELTQYITRTMSSTLHKRKTVRKGETSVRVAASTSQADTVQYKKNEQ
jgi:hypothetical protein